jgi:hypothetical protein
VLHHVQEVPFRSRSLRRSSRIEILVKSAAAGAVLCLAGCGWGDIDPDSIAAPSAPLAAAPVAAVPRVVHVIPLAQLASAEAETSLAELEAGRHVTHLVRTVPVLHGGEGNCPWSHTALAHLGPAGPLPVQLVTRRTAWRPTSWPY